VALRTIATAQDDPDPDPNPAADESAAGSCTLELRKSVDPEEIPLGDTARVTMVMSHTCQAERVPVDMVFVVDESNSMTRGRNNPGDIGAPDPTPKSTEPPRGTPAPPDPDPPTKEPPGNPGEPGDPGPGDVGGPGNEPPGCDVNSAVNPGGDIRTPPAQVEPPPKGTPGDPVPPDPPDPGPPPTKTPAIGGPGNGDPQETGEPAGADDLLREVKKWLSDLRKEDRIREDLDNNLLRVGMLAFNDKGRTLAKLQGGNQGYNNLGRTNFRGGGFTRVDLAMDRAERELQYQVNLFPPGMARQKVLVLLSDGAICSRDLRKARVNDEEVKVVTVFFGRGGWERRLRQLATEQRYHFTQREYAQFMDLYEDELAYSVPNEIDELIVRDTVEDNMELWPGAHYPPASVEIGRSLEWWGVKPSMPLTHTQWHWDTSAFSQTAGLRVSDLITVTRMFTLDYDVEPLEPGTWVIDAESSVTWRSTDGEIGREIFPWTNIDVLPPTATPTPTPTDTPTPTSTPTATPTPTPGPRYLPMVYKSWPEPTATPEVCKPRQQKVDVVIVVDTSTSMSESSGSQSKINAAIQASKTLAGLLKLDDLNIGDQASVIGFNDDATVLTPLTNDSATVTNALDQLRNTQAIGTRIDRALLAARDELRSARVRGDSTRSVVLVTDGQQVGGSPNDVPDAANSLRSDNVVVFTVGLGDNVSAQLLRDIATTPDRYRFAASADDLELIYEEIARLIPCPKP
jgi:Mg-chelatase subunit ChlD